MRHLLLAFASVLAASQVAHADPTSVAATTAEDPVPPTYVRGGMMAGINDRLFTAGASAEVGQRVMPGVWVHANMLMGAAGELFAHGNGSIVQARAGADLVTCHRGGALCAFAGADLGFQHTQFSGMSDPLFCDGDCQGNPVEEHHSHMIGVGRIGLDVGGKHLRWRPGLEASISGDGINGVNATQSLAYRF